MKKGMGRGDEERYKKGRLANKLRGSIISKIGTLNMHISRIKICFNWMSDSQIPKATMTNFIRQRIKDKRKISAEFIQTMLDLSKGFILHQFRIY